MSVCIVINVPEAAVGDISVDVEPYAGGSLEKQEAEMAAEVRRRLLRED